MKELSIEKADFSAAELTLALQLIDQIAQDAYDPSEFQDEEKQRMLAAIDKKISGKQVVDSQPVEAPTGAQVIDLMEALRASLGKKSGKTSAPAKTAVAREERTLPGELKERKGLRRVAKAAEPARARK